MRKNVYPYKKELGWFTVKKIEDDLVTKDLPDKLVGMMTRLNFQNAGDVIKN